MIARFPLALCLALALLAAWPDGAAAQLRIDEEDLFVGRPVTVHVPEATDTLRVIYRPSSSIARTEVIPVAGAQTVAWTPGQPGVVRLATDAGATLDLSVRFDRLPVAGLVVLVLAGVILFGGAIFASVKLFQRDAPGEIAPF